MMFIHSTFALFSLSLLASAANVDPVKTVFQFPPPSPPPARPSWLGNLAVRAEGSIIATSLFSPDLRLFDPSASQPSPQVITTFSNTNGTTGITETTPEVFEVVSGVFDLNQQAAPGTLQLWRVDLTDNSHPNVSLTANMPNVTLINGLTTLNPTTVLGSDSIKGIVWSINTETGAYAPALTDPLFLPGSNGSSLGINGVKVAHEGECTYLYFTNSAKAILGKVEINPVDGTSMGQPASMIATAPFADQGGDYDDFTLKFSDDGCVEGAYTANSRLNSISHINFEPFNQTIIAGAAMSKAWINSTEIAEPEAVAFGRMPTDKDVLYTVTTGNVANGKFVGSSPRNKVGAQLLAIDTTGQ